MLDDTLSALLRRADASSDEGMVSFGVGARDTAPPVVEELWQMIECARGQGTGEDDEAMVSFGVGEDGEGTLARIRRESSELVDGLLSALAKPYVIETGEGPTRIRTRVGWLGDTSTDFARGVSSEVIAAHVATTEASLSTSAHRLHMLVMVVIAAGKIATVIATPGGAVMALPIAYKCVREVYKRWSASSADPTMGGTPSW